MRHFKAIATLSFLFATGCGASADGGSTPGDELASRVDGATPGSAETGLVGTPNEATASAASSELARIEFRDGNVVRFEELDGGVLISEVGPELNPRHLVPKEGLTALEAFKSLSPERPVPERLLRLHERLYPPGATLGSSPGARAAAGAAPADQELELDPDLEHNGEFQQSYPAANFLQVMCDFPSTAPNYKHTNRVDPHTDVSMNVHTAYYAAGADIGTITAQACSGKNAGGYFNGTCSSTTAINAGYHASAYYDAGLQCDKTCTLLFGCVSICVPKQVRLELRYGKISSSVRFHECARITK